MRSLQIMVLRLSCGVLFPRIIRRRRAALLALAMLAAVAPAFAIDSEIIGLTALRRERPTITGAGIPVAQPEGQESANGWEVIPYMNGSVFFVWTSALGTATNYPNSVGVGSGHASGVATEFYDASIGMAPGVPRVDSYDADYYFMNIVVNKIATPARVINQSFVFSSEPSTAIDPIYDAYAATYNVLFVSGNSNVPDPVYAPGTAYNGISVGIISTSYFSSVGPTSDGRAKPDIVAPHSCCASFSTPDVSGAAALLLQAGAANDGGANTASLATNASTVKALLLNGAVKTTNWTNGVTRPLDARYGAGVLNIYNSDLQLRGGRRAAIATNNVGAGTAHPPTGGTNNVASLRGWDYSSIQSTVVNDRVAHYYFNLPTNGGAFSATATLVWKKNAGPLANLDMFLYNAANSNLVTCSTSSVDNVEHLFVPKLPAGRYDLQVLKHGGVSQSGTESYALAFDFSPVKLSLAKSGTNVVVAWPASPAMQFFRLFRP